MREAYQTVAVEAPWMLAGFVLILGLCIGSFLNVVIYRLPAGKSLVHPPSTCACGERIRWFDNIPVLSWLLLRGRARCCGRRFSVRYPLVEALTGGLFLALWLAYPPLVALAFMLFAAFMVCQAFIDWDTMEIPDVFSVGGFAIGLVLAVFIPAIHGENSGFWALDALRAVQQALLGGFIGSALILWIALFSEVLLRKEAMGFGDVKLMGAIGAFCGWQGAVFALFGGAVIGTILAIIVALAGWVTKKEPSATPETAEGEEAPHTPGALHDDEGFKLPFGPALGAGALVYLLVAREAFDGYVDFYAEVLRAGF